jgi:CPA2 family monovalent cation:H+ antiporter-2
MTDFSGWNILGEVLLLVGSAVALGVALESIKISAIIGYLLAGVLLGPSVFGLVGNDENLEVVAELGVSLLLFSIGLELTPTRLRGFGIRGAIVGVVQVVLTILIGTGVAILFGLEWREAAILGCMVALSSTAVVARLLNERGELESPRGRETLAVLLAQDGLLVPILLLVGFLGGTAGGTDAPPGIAGQLASAAVDILIMVASIAVLGIFVIPRLLNASILRRNRDFAIVIAITTCLAAAWGSHSLGLSPALGSFIAGVLLARVSFSRQIRADTGALRAVFLTLFFASVGMLANVREMVQPEVLKLLLAILFIGLFLKVLIAWFAIRITGGHRRIAIGAAICLAQFGEFSFVIGSEALTSKIISPAMFQAAIGASLISLFATPLLVAKAKPISMSIDRLLVRLHIWKSILPPKSSIDSELSGHIIIVGYGPAGAEVARTAMLAGLTPLVIDMNQRLVERAAAEGFRSVFGDGAQHEILEHIGASRAAAMVMTLPEPQAAMATITQFRSLNRDAIIVARGRYERWVADLETVGADYVISEESTAGTMLGATLVSRLTGDTNAAADLTEMPDSSTSNEDEA